ncbi:hypothetical protein pb186bvf_019187 [Paramecium bursaria]
MRQQKNVKASELQLKKLQKMLTCRRSSNIKISERNNASQKQVEMKYRPEIFKNYEDTVDKIVDQKERRQRGLIFRNEKIDQSIIISDLLCSLEKRLQNEQLDENHDYYDDFNKLQKLKLYYAKPVGIQKQKEKSFKLPQIKCKSFEEIIKSCSQERKRIKALQFDYTKCQRSQQRRYSNMNDKLDLLFNN